MSIYELTYLIAALVGALATAVSSVLLAYAAVMKAKAWRTWAERCDPKGLFQGPAMPKELMKARR